MFKKIAILATYVCLLPNAWAQTEEINITDLKVEFKKDQKEEIKTLEKITVKGAVHQSPSQVIDEDELTNRNSTSIGELLSQSSGVHNASYGNGVGRPVLRGLTGARVKVMQNGLDSADVASISSDHALAIDSDHAKQVEILSGPKALALGGQAMAGAVNVIDDRIPLNVIHTQNRFSSELSSVDSGAIVRLHNQHAFGPYSTQLSYSQRSQQDYQLNDSAHDSKQENSDVSQKNINAGFAWFTGSMEMGLAVSHMDHEFGLPGHDHEEEHEEDHEDDTVEDEPAHEEGEARVDLKQTRVDTQLNWALPSNTWQSLNWKLALVDYEHSEGHVEEESEAVDESSEHDHAGLSIFKRQSVESKMMLNYVGSDRHKGTLGLHLNGSDFSAQGGEAIVPATQSKKIALFAFHNFTLNPELNVEWAARLEQQRHDVDKSKLEIEHLLECDQTLADIKDTDFNFGSLSAALDYQFNPALNIRSTLSRVSRAPGAQELYSCGPHESSLTYEIGSSQLQTESAINLELVLNAQIQNWQWQLNLYRYNFNNFIYQHNLNTKIDDLDAYEYRQQEATFEGFETRLFRNFNDSFVLELFADSVTGEFNNGALAGKYVPRMPADRVGFELAYEKSLWKIFLRESRYQSQNKLAQNESATSGFDQVDIGAYKIWLVRSGELKLHGGVQNALDEERAYHTSIVKDVVSLPGRNLRLGVSYTF